MTARSRGYRGAATLLLAALAAGCYEGVVEPRSQDPFELPEVRAGDWARYESRWPGRDISYEVQVATSADHAGAAVLSRWINWSVDGGAESLQFEDQIDLPSGRMKLTAQNCVGPPGSPCNGRLAKFYSVAGLPGLAGRVWFEAEERAGRTEFYSWGEERVACSRSKGNRGDVAKANFFGYIPPYLAEGGDAVFCPDFSLPVRFEPFGFHGYFERVQARFGEGVALDLSAIDLVGNFDLADPPPDQHPWDGRSPPGKEPAFLLGIKESIDWLFGNDEEFQQFLKSHPLAYLHSTSYSPELVGESAPLPAIGSIETARWVERELSFQSETGSTLTIELRKSRDPILGAWKTEKVESASGVESPRLQVDELVSRAISPLDATNLAMRAIGGKWLDTRVSVTPNPLGVNPGPGLTFYYLVLSDAGATAAGPVSFPFLAVVRADLGVLVYTYASE